MAGFGDLALAFAGGAAKQINEDAAAERNSRMRTEERMKELQAQQRIRMEESRYAQKMKDYESDRNMEKMLKSAGGNKAMEQYLIAKSRGMSPKELALFQKSSGGKLKPLTWTSSETTAPTMNLTSMDEAVRGAKTKSTVRKLLGLGDKEEETTNIQESVEATVRTPAVTYGGGDVDWSKLTDRNLVVINDQLIDKDTNEIVGDFRTTVTPKEEQFTGVPKPFREIATGKEVYLTEKDGLLHKDGKPVTQADYRLLTEDEATRRSGSRATRVAQIKEQANITGEVINSATQLAKFRTAEQSGVPGAAKGVAQFFIDQVESFAGAAVGKDGIKPTTLAYHMANDFSGDKGKAQSWLEERMAQGKAQVYETFLLYKTAKMMKPDGKLNVDDITRAEGLLGTGIGGGRGEAGAISAIVKEATQRGKNDVLSYLSENQIPTTGRVAYDPEGRTWIYEVMKDGKPFYEKLY